MLVSDEVGCDFFRGVVKNRNIDLLFSKDFSCSFVHDMLLVLKSKFYYQYLGGGMGIVAFFSKIPFEIISPARINEVMWAKRKIASWHTKNQIMFLINENEAGKGICISMGASKIS